VGDRLADGAMRRQHGGGGGPVTGTQRPRGRRTARSSLTAVESSDGHAVSTESRGGEPMTSGPERHSTGWHGSI
jgi:hypothetical protein